MPSILPCEVLYVDELVVSAGSTLLTNGCPIYARSATIDGTVDDPGNIIIVEDGCAHAFSCSAPPRGALYIFLEPATRSR